MRYLSALFFLLAQFSFSQTNVDFQSAYNQSPNLPSGILETVAWTRTRMVHLTESTQESCIGIPRAIGIMGLFENGKNYFKENAVRVAELSGISIEQQKLNLSVQINAYGIAFSSLFTQFLQTNTEERSVYLTLDALSEIPDSCVVNLFAKDAQIYEVMKLMCDESFTAEHQITRHHYQLSAVFGSANLSILSAQRIEITPTAIITNTGAEYTLSSAKSAQYGPAIWSPAPSCNYSSRNGTAVSAITIHTVQGSYAGAISWAQNCASNVSFHYVIRSSDGQVTQLVNEANKGWHVGSENPYTIGYEHEGYVDNASWYTQAMYESSASLSRDITLSGYGISPLRTYYGAASSGSNVLGGCTKIKGHQHYPNQSHTDPGINWQWEKYYRLINNAPVITTISAPSGTFYDTGGAGGNYTDDQRKLWLFQPAGVTSVHLNFTAFNIEANYDKLFIYDGATINAPLIGVYTGTTSPGNIISSSGSLLIEFRSDCATNASGWVASYTSVPVYLPNVPPVTTIPTSTTWKTANFTTVVTDTDSDSPIATKFHLISDKQASDNGWKSNLSKSFVNENFQDNASSWTTQVGNFGVSGNAFEQTNLTESNTNAYINVNQPNNLTYLYSWKQTFTSTGTDQRAGIHFMCSNPLLTNRGDSYFVYLRESNGTVQIYSVDSDVFTLNSTVNYPLNVGTTYSVKTTYSTQTGWIKVYINDVFVSSWQDPTPLASGTAISLRTGNCAVKYDDIRMYQSHTGTLSVDLAPTGHMRYDSEGGSHTGFIQALSVDATNLWSTPSTVLYLVDRSSPDLVSLADGSASDIDSTTSTTLQANWNFADIHSGVTGYEYAIGTSSGSTNVVGWTNSSLLTTLSHVLVSPIYNQTYYISVRATNGAGLVSTNSTDGQLLLSPDAGLTEDYLAQLVVFPNPTSDELNFKNVKQAIQVALVDLNGKTLLTKTITSSDSKISLIDIAAGQYSLMIQSGSQLVLKAVSVIH